MRVVQLLRSYPWIIFMNLNTSASRRSFHASSAYVPQFFFTPSCLSTCVPVEVVASSYIFGSFLGLRCRRGYIVV